jgi:hypothetical protein
MKAGTVGVPVLLSKELSSCKAIAYISICKACGAIFSVVPILYFSFKQNDSASGLELDLEKYVVPTTPKMGSGVVYAA